MPRLIDAFEMPFTLVVEGESGPDDEVLDGALPTLSSPNSPPRVRLVEPVVHAAGRLIFPRLIVVAIVCVVVVLGGPLGIALLLRP